MALITHIQLCGRKIRAVKKTVLEVNFDRSYFSMWTRAAGAEQGDVPSYSRMQLDRRQAAELCALLQNFLEEEN